MGGLAEQKQERQLRIGTFYSSSDARARAGGVEDGKASTVAKALEERTLRFLILDEADRCCARGPLRISSYYTPLALVDHAERPRKRWQALVFSATLACGSTQPRGRVQERRADADPRALLKAVEPLRRPATRKLEVVDLTSRKEEDADEEEEETAALPATAAAGGRARRRRGEARDLLRVVERWFKRGKRSSSLTRSPPSRPWLRAQKLQIRAAFTLFTLRSAAAPTFESPRRLREE